MKFLAVNFGNFYGRIKYSSAVSALVDMYCSFSLLALSIVCCRADNENEPKKKGHRAAWSFGLPGVYARNGYSSKLPKIYKLASLHGDDHVMRYLGRASMGKFRKLYVCAVGKADKQCKILFSSFSGAQQAAKGGAKKPPGGAFNSKKLRYSSFYLLLFIGLAACARDARISLPELTPTFDNSQQKACAAIFPRGPFQFVHSIEFAMADGPLSTVIGVTSLAGDEISCALMTVEGLTLFAAVFKTGAEPEVRRAVPPFDRPDFARGLRDDVRTIFVPPPAEDVLCGKMADNTPVCRSTAVDGRITDIMPAEDCCWRITTYTPELVIDRSVVARSCRKNGGAMIPDYLELTGFGREKYTLKMKLITAEEIRQLP